VSRFWSNDWNAGRLLGWVFQSGPQISKFYEYDRHSPNASVSRGTMAFGLSNASQKVDRFVRTQVFISRRHWQGHQANNFDRLHASFEEAIRSAVFAASAEFPLRSSEGKSKRGREYQFSNISLPRTL